MAGMSVGNWVSLNPVSEDPRAAMPSGAEQGIGLVKQVQQAAGDTVYQVVWNPGNATPRSAWYHESELTQLSQQQAQSIAQQMANGQPPQLPKQSSQYQQPAIPTEAVPPQFQGLTVSNVTSEG